MDEVKWAWVLLVAATLALLIRLAMWFLPEPGWRSAKVTQAAEVLSSETGVVEEAAAPFIATPEPEVAAAPAVAENIAREPAPEPAVAEPAPAAAVPAVAETAPVAPPSPPPVYNLRLTRWGMSRADVEAAELNEPIRENATTLVYATTTLELPCVLTYYFEEGRLTRARLSFADPDGVDIPPLNAAQAQRRFLFLREQLRSRYGQPVQRTFHQPRDVSGLQRTAEQQEELAQQYDVEIAEAEQRLQKQRDVLTKRFRRWSNAREMVERGLAPYERDIRDLRQWKKDALARADQSRRDIQAHRSADTAQPLIGVMLARWPYAREAQNIELRLDCRGSSPRLDVRYEAAPKASGWGYFNDL
jgi:hypothetical protein